MQAKIVKKLKACLQPGKHIHLVGIGGVSMRPLAIVLRDRGMEISGSDMNASVSTEELQERGITVYIGHKAENIKGACCVIRTAAAHNDNPEIAAARAAGIPVFERAQAWGVLMQEYQNAICIAGTHGKTTTTSMVTHIFMEARKDPTVMLGGYLPLLHAGHRVGSGDTIIAESCEYCNSFHNFSPTLAVINNIEEDHLDFFKDLDEIKASFRHFAELVPAGGCVIANGDDANTMEALEGLPLLRFGLGQENDVHPEEVSEDWRSCTVICGGKPYCRLSLAVYGKFNLINALGACAVAWHMGIDGETAARALAEFRGAGRRLEYKGRCNGAEVYDDYAHHPHEVRALLEAVRTMGYERVILAFQPHTYSRTKALFHEFVEELQKPDLLVLAEIYAARERNVLNIHSSDLAAEIPGAVCFDTLPEVSDYLRAIARPGDIILTVGAGDIYKAGEAICEG
ncbi:MAG: UDP-N-acetylmuramate--L-alanine ligase [Oscillospiraceae bacterium]|nr:UDP-N-acetylmuramate--L-alanine ligase [Oscillospiraceae bacterium]